MKDFIGKFEDLKFRSVYCAESIIGMMIVAIYGLNFKNSIYIDLKFDIYF